MKMNAVKGALLAALFCLAAAHAAAAAEFAAKVAMTRGGGPPSEGYVYVSGQKVRSDMAGPYGLILTISRPDKNLTWIVNVHRKEYVELAGMVMGPVGTGNAKAWAKLADRKELGKEKVEGYLCRKLLYTFHDKKKGTIMQWKAKKLNFVIKSIYSGPKGELVITKFTKIKERPVDKEMFRVPAGYKLVARRKLAPPAAK